ncbi:MAG TPA: DUF58 domain-containing protein [Planctomycetota bacterium]|nr:DUF58 domain-containing protein [Planctomycetota bacterium]
MRSISELLPPSALARLSNLNLIARWIVEGFISGLHKSPYHGFSIEFAEYRPYTAGDDLRHFDWKVLAKSERKYVKKYHSETNMQAHLLLDCSASMGFGEPVTKLRYGQAIAAALAHLMIMQQDAAGVAVFADKILDYLPPRASMRHFQDVSRILSNAKPQSSTNIFAALEHLAEAVKRRGMFVIVSDLYDDVEKILAAILHIRFNKHEVILFHILDHKELEFPYRALSEFKDLETSESVQVAPMVYREAYKTALREFTDTMRRKCANMLVDYQLVDTQTPFDKVLAEYLFKRQKLN